jgi:hypothetical protein
VIIFGHAQLLAAPKPGPTEVLVHVADTLNADAGSRLPYAIVPEVLKTGLSNHQFRLKHDLLETSVGRLDPLQQ